MKKSIENGNKGKKEIFLALMAIGFHLLILLMAFWSYHMQNPDAGLDLIYERMTTAGDAPHYLFLAKEGYQSAGEKANLIVFYPLYPLLIRLTANLLLMRNYELAGILISQVGMGIATVYLYRLIRTDYCEERAVDGVFLFLTYPFMMFTMGVFTEGLFLALVISALYYIRKHNWVWAGILGMCASSCRTQGMLLLAPALYELVYMYTEQKKKWRTYFNWRQLFICIIPFGFIFYLLLNYIKQGNLFAFIGHQSAPPWFQTTQWINENFTKDFGMAQEYRVLGYFIYWVQMALFFIAVGMLLYGIKKKVRTCLIVFGGIYTCFSYLPGWLISGPRYMIGCVPLYFICAAIEKASVRKAVLMGSTALCVLYTILFLQGQAIM